MPAFNFYNLDLTKFPKDFKTGDKVRAYLGVDGKGGSEGWTTILAQYDADHFIIDAEDLKWVDENRNGHACIAKRRLIESGWYFELEGQMVRIVHIDDLKSEAQGREESYRYHEEEAMMGMI